MKRNWEALVLRAMGGRNFRLTVLDTEPVGDRYRRLLMDGGGLLDARSATGVSSDRIGRKLG